MTPRCWRNGASASRASSPGDGCRCIRARPRSWRRRRPRHSSATCCNPGRRRLPEDNVRRFRNRLRGPRDRWLSGTIDQAAVRARVTAWIAHAAQADTWRLRRAIFRDGWFDPSREPGRPPVGVSSAAGPGTTIRGTCAPASATGTTRTTETMRSGSVSPARLHARAGGITVPSGVPRVRSGAAMMSGVR